MPRYRLTIEYDGGPFVGWQRQDNGPSVQGAIEAAGQALTGAAAPCYGAGRTDAGVHALAMTAHIDLCRAFPAETVRDALNAHLRPAPVSILQAAAAPEGFHARYSCHGRRYLYRVLNRRTPPALARGRVWQVPGPLDCATMATAAQTFIGKHDFTTFRSSYCQADSPIRSMDSFTVAQTGEEIHFSLAAISFLHNQVRSLVGTLVQVGLGRWTISDVEGALAARDRSTCGPVAPAAGLYFAGAIYEDDGLGTDSAA